MPGVTISAGYGAGGSVVAPAVAERLDLPLLDRAISVAVASQLKVSVQEAEKGEPHRSLADRFLSVLAPVAGGVLGAGTDAAPADFIWLDDAAEFRQQAERVMRRAVDTGAVVLGRAGAAALRDDPRVLRVRLFGAPEARIRQGARLGGLDEQTAARQQPEVDAAREHYIRRLYSVGADDPELFHLQLDSTVLPLEACTDIIVVAFTALVPGSSRQDSAAAASAPAGSRARQPDRE